MLIQIPDENNRITQINDGEMSGNVWASWNLDLVSNSGKIRISPMTSIVASDLSGSMVYSVAIVRSSASGTDSWWVLCDKKLYFDPTIPMSSLLKPDTIANSPKAVLNYKYSDMAEFALSGQNASLLITGGTDVAKLTAGTWTANWYVSTLAQSAGLTNNVPHPICVGFNNLCLIGDKNKVVSIDNASTVNASRLTFKSEFETTWIISSSSGYWVGCRNTQDREAEVFFWDGYSQNFNSNYKVGSDKVFCGIIKDGICYIINGRGQLMAFNGAGFSEVAKFPIITSDGRDLNDNNNLSIHKNGIAVIDNNIHILVNAAVGVSGAFAQYSMLENMLSGIWEYSKEHGLVHKYSISKDTGSGITAYGSPLIIFGGALTPIPREQGLFYAGGYLYQGDVTQAPKTIGVINKLNVTDTLAKVGYFITSKIPCSQVQENWQKIYALIKKLINSTDKIYIKYRIENKIYGTAGQTALNKYGFYAQWVDGTTFIYSGPGDALVEVGEEVEFLSGEGSGLSANIVSIDGTTTIHIDETIADVSGYSTARIGNWKKLGTDISTQGLENFEIPIDKQSSWIQFKIICFFTGKNEIEKLIIKNEPQLKAI